MESMILVALATLLTCFCDLILCYNNKNNFIGSWHEELFGKGHLQLSDGQHLSSSTSDLIELFRVEKQLVVILEELLKQNNQTTVSKKARKTIRAYQSLVDFSKSTDIEDYVKHPINAFHMLKRMAKWLPMLKSDIPSLKIHFQLPNEYDAAFGVAHGLADIQEHYNLDVNDMIQGRIVSSVDSERVFNAASNLTSHEITMIAQEASKVKYLEGYVSWLQGALDAVQAENRSNKNLKKLEKQAREYHDEIHVKYPMKNLQMSLFKIRETMFNKKANKVNKSALKDPLYKNTLQMLEDSYDKNLYEKEGFQRDEIFSKYEFYFRRRIQKLCNGSFQRPAHLDRDMKCTLLHHGNPYLRLGPFKYEKLNANPEVALIHGMLSDAATDKITQGAKPFLKPTPFNVGTEQKSFSKLRTSKVMYMNEGLWDNALQMSNDIQNITAFRLYHEPYASENFQVMNYGIGGKISGHFDASAGEEATDRTSQADKYGGIRMVTFMFYLTDVELGGHTIFPQLGIWVRPERGSALYWFNIGPQVNMDTRSFHLGCPVLVGNKWIANKWIKWPAQMAEYPCAASDNLTHFSISKTDRMK